MSISSIGSSSSLASAYAASVVQQQQPAKAAQQAPKSDTVTISKQAQAFASEVTPKLRKPERAM